MGFSGARNHFFHKMSLQTSNNTTDFTSDVSLFAFVIELTAESAALLKQ